MPTISITTAINKIFFFMALSVTRCVSYFFKTSS
jgi:hypothetical protein